MNPWTIIGWALIILVLALILFKVVIPLITTVARVCRSLNTKPKEGQVWNFALSDGRLEVTGVYETHIAVNTYRKGYQNRAYAAFSIKPDGWKTYLMSKLVYLPKDTK